VQGRRHFGHHSGTLKGKGAPRPSTLLSAHDLIPIAHAEPPELRILKSIELAVTRCGSAAALARVLGVKAPTVSQWRAQLKLPDALHLLKIQDVASGRNVDLVARPRAPADSSNRQRHHSHSSGGV